MLAILSLLVIITLAIVITRIASSALTLTGLSPDIARFQARSAFTGCGFTTAEAEDMVRHPVRRRIIMLLMLLGNAGLVTSMSTLLLSFVNITTTLSGLSRAALLVAGLLALWLLARSRWIDQQMSRLIEWALRRTSLNVQDYASLLNMSEGFTVAELPIREEDWLAGKRLRDANLPDEGLVVLAIRREDGDYVGVPTGNDLIYAKDSLVVYGQDQAVDALRKRERGSPGEVEHVEAVEKENRRLRSQEMRELRREQEKKEQEDESGLGGTTERADAR